MKTKFSRTVLMLALVAAIVVSITGGTIAYLTDTDSDVNVMTLGNVDIEQLENGKVDGFNQNQPLYPAYYPGEELKWDDTTKGIVDKAVTVENKGTSEAYVRTWFAFEAGDMTWDEFNKYILRNVNTTDWAWEWDKTATYEIEVPDVGLAKYYIAVATLTEALALDSETEESLIQLAMAKEADNSVVTPLGDEYVVLVLSQAMQTANFEDMDDPADALAIGFGDKEAGNAIGINHPWQKDTADTWDGTADDSWYNDTDTEFMIMTAEQLAGFAELVDGGNTFAGKTVKLGKDIDLHYVPEGKTEPKSFNPIGYGYDVVFKGTFDGQDHTISNLYQDGGALGYSYSTAGGGLFASVVDATIKNLTLENPVIVMECIDMGTLVGYSYGNCTYENIEINGGSIANYQRYTGGVVGEVNGTQTFKNVDVTDTVVSSLWGDFDASLGGIIGGKWGDATVIMEDCDVACEINAYNDVTSTYQWYAYRRAGMLIGNSEETKTEEGRTSATASYLTATNCTVTYGEWADYTYCEFAGTNWPYVRVQGSEVGHCSPYSNPRYGVATDANGNKAVDDNHVHNEGEDHNIELPFDQLFGGGQGVYGTATHDGVTVKYPN